MSMNLALDDSLTKEELAKDIIYSDHVASQRKYGSGSAIDVDVLVVKRAATEVAMPTVEAHVSNTSDSSDSSSSDSSSSSSSCSSEANKQ